MPRLTVPWPSFFTPPRPRPPATLAFAVLIAAGCHDADLLDDTGDTAPLDDGYALHDVVVDWQPCSLIDGEDDGLAECAMVELPLFWGEDDGQVFQTWAKRLVDPSRTPSGQLWLLHGGPGGSGTIGLASWMAEIRTEQPSLDVYTLDPRGTGYSEFLECPDQQAPGSEQGSWVTLDELPACVAYVEEHYGDRLSVYGTTSAAIDLAALMTATEREGVDQLIWGGSGGTYWSQRFLQLFPELAEGVVIEGIVPPDESLVFQDEYDEEIAHRVLELCAEDPFCADKLPDPEATVAALLAKMDQGHCAGLGMDSDSLRSFVRTMDYYHLTMAMVPALIYRLDRCSDDDFDAIVSFYYALWGGESDPREMSTLLFFNEGWSELWEHRWFADNEALLAYLDEVHADGTFTMGLGYERNDYYLGWPRYTDPLDDTWAESDVPMLMLQGELDPSTPLDFALDVGEHFTGEHQHWTQFRYSPHNVISGSPLSHDAYAEHCGERLFYAFLLDPRGALDTSCVDEVAPLDFEGLVYAPYVFGTEDYWENKHTALLVGPNAPLFREIEVVRHGIRTLPWAFRPNISNGF
jgi:pimeloyl-ACP methyl ester carboxylesterase